MKNRIKVLIAGLALTLSAGAQAATISVNTAVDPVIVGDLFTVTVDGADFSGGSNGGGITFSWDATMVSLVSYDATNLTFPGDQFFGRAGTLSAGSLDDASVSSFAGTVLTDFEIATFSFKAGTVTGLAKFGVTQGLFGNGLPDIWVDEDGSTESNPAFVGGDVTIINEVPIPAAAWLFGSGLLGLAGLKRRKASA